MSVTGAKPTTPEAIALEIAKRAIGQGLSRLPIAIGRIVAAHSPADADEVAKAADALLKLAQPHLKALIDAGAEWVGLVATDISKALNGDGYPAWVTVGKLEVLP